MDINKLFTVEEIEFLVHSNAIEGVYDIDSLMKAQKAWLYLRSKRRLTLPVILKTHAILMKDHLEKDELGALRTVQVWVGNREGKPWYAVPNLITQWCEFTNSDKSELAIKLRHIDYEKIHPFIDGNGRTGRMFMNWQRLKLKLPILVIHEGEEQKEYYGWFK